MNTTTNEMTIQETTEAKLTPAPSAPAPFFARKQNGKMVVKSNLKAGLEPIEMEK